LNSLVNEKYPLLSSSMSAVASAEERQKWRIFLFFFDIAKIGVNFV
jgi:hypothetical protein